MALPSPWSAEFYRGSNQNTQDEIEHYGNKNSGRYRRGSGKHPKGKHPDAVFISGTSKLKSKEDGYYRKSLPKEVTQQLDTLIQRKAKIMVGDCVGVDVAVQKYLYNKGYTNVEIYVSGQNVRNNADVNNKLGWKINHVDASKYEEGSKEWHAEKDKAMTKQATSGLAIVLENGSAATKKNVDRLMKNNKEVLVFQLNEDGADHWIDNKNKRG